MFIINLHERIRRIDKKIEGSYESSHQERRSSITNKGCFVYQNELCINIQPISSRARLNTATNQRPYGVVMAFSPRQRRIWRHCAIMPFPSHNFGDSGHTLLSFSLPTNHCIFGVSIGEQALIRAFFIAFQGLTVIRTGKTGLIPVATVLIGTEI